MTRTLIKDKVNSPKSFDWLCQMRFYFDPKNPDVLQQLSIQMANAKFNYGFEYLGVQEKLVQTPLTDRCYLTMTQALEARLGGSPFGTYSFVVFLEKKILAMLFSNLVLNYIFIYSLCIRCNKSTLYQVICSNIQSCCIRFLYLL